MKLLTTSNAKIEKSQKLGYITYGMHLAPANLSGFNVCQSASAGCAAACLNTAGMGKFNSVQKARINKTLFFFKDRPAFMAQLVKEIESSIKSAARKGMIPCFRLNLTSDLPWEKIKTDNGQTILERFPNQQFYDYTKVKSRVFDYLGGRFPSNYHLTFSRSEETEDLTVRAYGQSNVNVAVVFRGSLPDSYLGLPVVNGDDTDLRFLDPKGSVVGLVEKGLAKKDETGFVVEVEAA